MTSTAKQSDYTVKSSTTDVVRWCVGQDGGKVRLKVVLNRRYPELASMSSNLSVESNTVGEIGAPLTAQLATTTFDRGRITLVPGGTAVLNVDLQPGETARFHTEYDGFAQSLIQLQLGLELTEKIVEIVYGKGASGFGEMTPECMSKIVDVATNADDSERVGSMLETCVNPETMLEGLTGRAVEFAQNFVVPLLKTSAFVHASANAFADIVRGKDKYDIVIARAKTASDTGTAGPGSSAYPAGQWSGRSRTLQLAADGTGSAMYLVHGPTGGCTSGSGSKDPCYFNVQFKLNGGSDPNEQRGLTGRSSPQPSLSPEVVRPGRAASPRPRAPGRGSTR
ncbi:hypothetical protein [Pseudonocardia xishanensis]|uniref:hypothetical protein n=1 Tax=Pseudonocardia xishanensis TaxID=630995 RepID=UPI0031EA5895